MGSIDIKKYIDCPAAVFDLQGRCWPSETGGVPCRIHVGPRRFLNVTVHPEELKLTLWHSEGGQLTYLPGEPVETTVDQDGTLLVDAVELVKQHFGKPEGYCAPDQWRWNKYRPWSDIFLTTPYGLASSYSVWLDIDWTHSTLRFVPGTLTLCGHDVRSIHWSTFQDECGAHSATMRPLVEQLLSGPRTLTAEDLMKPLRSIRDPHLNALTIITDRGEYVLDSSLNPYIAVRLADGTGVGGYQFKGYTSALTQVDIALQLMQADSAEDIRATLERLKQSGLVKRRK